MKPSKRRGSRPTNADAELLGQLPDKGIARGFTELDMAPRQVPDARVRDAFRAPLPQEHSLLLNQSRGYHFLHIVELITAADA
jgi:hypothetical protein